MKVGVFSRLGMVVLAATLSGCMDGFYHRPVIEDSVKYRKSKDGDDQYAIGTLALDASRRVVVVRVIDRPGEPGVGKFCAEPPPAIANETNTSFQAGLTAGADITKTVSANANGSVIKNVVVLPEGSRAIDMMRVGAYALCQYHLNGAIADAQMGREWDRLLEAVKHVADMETRQPPSPVPVALPAPVPSPAAVASPAILPAPPPARAP